MKERRKDYPLRGYTLLPPSPVQGYRGVDRHPFVPTLLEEEMDSDAKPVEPYVWTFYPPGWRRNAFRLYEENLVPGTGDELDLIASKEAAQQIKGIIEPHIGLHEIVACQIWSLDYPLSDRAGDAENFLGYDIAYLGGDFYSAVLNGLFVNPAPALAQYKPLLNKFGLFPTISVTPEYLHQFKQEARSEENAEFYVWGLELVGEK